MGGGGGGGGFTHPDAHCDEFTPLGFGFASATQVRISWHHHSIRAALEEKTAETSHDEAGIIEAATLLPAAAGILFLSVLRYYGYLNVWESASTEILGIPTVSKCMRLEYYCNVYSTL